MTTHKTHIAEDWMRDGIKIALLADLGGGTRQLYDFSGVTVTTYTRDEAANVETSDAPMLALHNDAARALYEALAEHFGHVGHDGRALRKDYDAERARVDKLIGHLTSGAR